MKHHHFKVPSFEESKLDILLRTQWDYITLILNVIRFIIVNSKYKYTGTSNLDLIIHIDTMSRVFIGKHNKIVSFNFPFYCNKLNGNTIEISTKNGIIIDSWYISEALSIITEIKNKGNLSLLERLNDQKINKSIVYFLEELISIEPCYIRYDYDPARENGKLHPLYHMDINYSNSGSYKIGLNDKIILDDLLNITNTTTDCSFLNA